MNVFVMRKSRYHGTEQECLALSRRVFYVSLWSDVVKRG